MSGYSVFAVAGVGGIGTFIARELAQQPGVRVVGLTRVGSRTVMPPGVRRREVDYADPAALAAALRGVHVVISALAMNGIAVQTALANAAKKAGVALFLPSEFGLPADDKVAPIFAGKIRFREYLKSIDLPYSLVFTGMFTDQIFSPRLGVDIPNSRATIIGPGDAPATFTTRLDIGRFLAHALTQVAPSELAWSSLRIEGERSTFMDVIATIEEVKKVRFQVTHRDTEEVRRKLGPNPGPDKFADILGVLCADGYGNVGTSDNRLFPDFNPCDVRCAIEKYY